MQSLNLFMSWWPFSCAQNQYICKKSIYIFIIFYEFFLLHAPIPCYNTCSLKVLGLAQLCLFIPMWSQRNSMVLQESKRRNELVILHFSLTPLTKYWNVSCILNLLSLASFHVIIIVNLYLNFMCLYVGIIAYITKYIGLNQRTWSYTFNNCGHVLFWSGLLLIFIYSC